MDYKINQILNPELEVNYYVGLLPDFENVNEQYVSLDNLQRKFNAYGIALCPKIAFNLSDDSKATAFQMLPRYSFTKITANGTFTTFPNNTNQNKGTAEQFSFSEIRHSFGIGVGIICYVSEKTNDRLAINLYYDGIDFGNSLSNLKFTNNRYFIKDSFGLGINYYFSFSNTQSNP